MALFFNELSMRPLASSAEGANARVLGLIRALSSLNKEGTFKHLRIAESFYASKWSEDFYTSQIWSSQSLSKDETLFLKTILVRPYLPDDDPESQEAFVLSQFTALDHEGISQIPEGLAAAYLKSGVAFSLDSDPYWQQPTLAIQVDSGAPHALEPTIINLSSPSLLQNPAYLAFKNARPPFFDSRKKIEEFFSADFSFEDRAIEDLIACRYNNLHDRAIDLIFEIRDYPVSGGRGKTEMLKNLAGRCSKRVSDKDRLVYTPGNPIVIHQCLGHYDDK